MTVREKRRWTLAGVAGVVGLVGTCGGILVSIGSPVLAIRDDVKDTKRMLAEDRTRLDDHEKRISATERAQDRIEAKIDVLLDRTKPR